MNWVKDYVTRGKEKISSLIAHNFAELGHQFNNQPPSNFGMVVKIITKIGGVFETNFKTDLIGTSIKLYGAANQTIEAPDWKSVVAKEVNSEKKVMFGETEDGHVHCILRWISHFVNKFAYKKINKACN